MKRLRVALLCSGVGDVHRGSETFFQSYFEAIRSAVNSSVTVDLFQGGGERPIRGARRLLRLSRDSSVAGLLGRARIPGGGPWARGFWTESVTYAASFLVTSLLERPRYDVVHVTDSQLKNIVSFLKHLRLVPSRLVFSLGVPYSLLRKGFLRDNPFVDIYHFSNHNDYETAQHDGILPSCRLRYIPQGVNTNLFARGSKERGERLRSQYGISRLARVITSVGMFDESKNMQSLLDAVAGLDGDVHLVVFGQGGGRDLLGRARSLLGDAFHFHTVEQQRLADFLHATDVFVFPGMVEGFGRCIIEAASTGTPCLVHDDSWFSHLIPDACFRLDMRDARGLSQRIACCLGHMTEMRSRFTSVRDYALRQFDWTELVPRYVQELYVPRASASSRAGNG